MFNGALSDLGLGTDPWNANRYMFGGGNPVSRVELNGHLNANDSSGGGGIIQADLDLCGSDCHLEGGNVVGAKPDSMTTAIDNFNIGAVQGILELGDQSVVSTIRRAVGVPTDSELYKRLLRSQASPTSTAPATTSAASPAPSSSPPGQSAAAPNSANEQPSLWAGRQRPNLAVRLQARARNSCGRRGGTIQG